MFALVGHREPLARMVFGLPGGGDLGADARVVRARFLRRERGIEAVEQELGDALILAQHRAPRAFGGVRREHGLDADTLQILQQLLERDAAGLHVRERRFDTARLRARAGLEKVATPTADAMYLLGEVHRTEPHRECAREIAGHLRRAAAQLYREFRR